jgi:hypothetical protein
MRLSLRVCLSCGGSILAKRAIEAVEQRPEGVEGDGAATSIDEHLGRHPGNDLDSVQRSDSFVVHANLRGVIRLVGPFVEKAVGGDVRDNSLESRDCKTCSGTGTTIGCPNFRSHRLWPWGTKVHSPSAA